MAPLMPNWNTSTLRKALATHDIGAVFRALLKLGWTQRAVGERVGIRQSDVNEVLHGRRVTTVTLLERIADAFDIPRGYMGLAFTNVDRQAGPVPDLVDRALKVMLGEEVERTQWLLEPPVAPTRVGRADADAINKYFLSLQRIENLYSGQLLPAQALIRQLQRLLRAEMPEDVRARLARQEGWMNSFAGWTAIDAGNFELGMSHFSRALEIAGQHDDDLGKCRALFSAGKAEMTYGDPEQALKLHQLGIIPAGRIKSELYKAAFSAHSALAVAAVKPNEPRHAINYVGKTWDFYSAMRPENEYEGMPSFFNRPDLLGITGQALVSVRPEKAIEDLNDCLAGRQELNRSVAFEKATLAHAHLAAGNADVALTLGREAVTMARAIRSGRKKQRFQPLRKAARKYGSDEMKALALSINKL